MKLTIYIVDDEKMAIKYLHYLLEHCDLEYEVVGEATNSERALSDIVRYRPDIVFADINMPVMDGLRLSEEILKRIQTRIFLLTSYRDFDYVQKGIQIGAANYILKNELNEESLQTLLEKTAREIEMEQKQHHRLLEYNVRQFLLSESEELDGEHIYEHKPMQRYALISLLPAPHIYMKHRTAVEKSKADSYELHSLPFPKGIECSAFTEFPNKEMCGLFFIHSDVADGQFLLMEAGKILCQYLEDKGVKICCVISDTYYHFLDLQKAYREMRILEDYLYSTPGQQIFHTEELRKKSGQENQFREYWEKISRKLEEEEFDEARRMLEELLEQSRQCLNIWEYAENLRIIYRKLRDYAEKMQVYTEILECPDMFENAEEAENELLQRFDTIYQEKPKKAGTAYSPYIMQAMEYIRKNYEHDISIPDIADAAKVSEGHLRRLFKQELGIKVVDYLTEYRLECAKLLMKNGENRLGEIWSRTGFSSAQYFSYVFKKKEGVLPKDYVKQAQSR